MANTIKIKAGSGTPTTTDIVDKELAFDRSADKLYINDNGTIVDLTGSGASGDIEGVTAGTGLSGGGTSGTVTLSLGNHSADLLTSGTVALARLNIPSSGDWFSGGVPTVATDGVMEIGRFIDFHNSDTTTDDYHIRLDCESTSVLNVVGGTLEVGGSQVLTAGDTIDISSQTNLSAGTNISLSGDTLNVDDAFIKNDANDTSSGTITAAGFTTSGSVTSDTLVGNSNNTNTLLFDDDQSGASNMVTLQSINHINVMTDGNNNATGDFRVYNGSYDTDTADLVFQVNSTGKVNVYDDLRVPSTISHSGDTDTYISFTNNRIRLYAGGSVKVDTDDTYLTSSGILDQDDMSSNSATAVASQQSIKAYVDAEVAGIVDSAPSALNTLNELAAALGDDENFATTTSTSLGNRLRVDTASQGLTGTQQANAITNLGITATKAELNYVDGVTSNIQTQLDAKIEATLTNEQVQDIAGGMFSSNTETGIAATYQDGDGTIDLVVDYLPATDDRDVKPNAITTSGVKQVRAYFTSLGGLTGTADSDYQDLLVLSTYSDGTGGDVNALAFDKSTQNIYHYLADQSATTWGTPKRIAYIENGSNNRVMTASSSSTVNGEANLTFDGTDLAIAATGKIYLDGGGNSYIQEESADNLIFRAAGGNYLRVTGSNIVLNDPGASYDVRIEGDTDSNLFFADGSADKIGIGTNAPDEKLHIFGAAPFIKIENSTETSGGILFVDQQDEGQNASVRFDASARSLDFLTDSGEAMTILGTASSRRVGIGETSPISKLHVQDANDISMASTGIGQMSVEGNGYTLGIALNGSGAFIYHNSSSRFLSLGTNETEQVRLTTGGALHVVDDVVAFSSTPSDKKLKTNVKDIEYGLDTIMKLKPKQYDWKKDDRHDIGFIAQEVEEVIPEIVKDNEWFDDKVKTLDYEKLTAVLIKAVQELKTEIEELKK